MSRIFAVDRGDGDVRRVDGCLKRLLEVVAQSRWDDEKGGFIGVDDEGGYVSYSHGGNNKVVKIVLGCIISWDVPNCIFCVGVALG
jgi:hypothetical protein